MTQTAKPYRQGFNKETGEIVVVICPEDVQAALTDHSDCDGKYDECKSVTISREAALAFMEEREEKIVSAILQDWAQDIADVAAALDFNPPKETKLND